MKKILFEIKKIKYCVGFIVDQIVKEKIIELEDIVVEIVLLFRVKRDWKKSGYSFSEF